MSARRSPTPLLLLLAALGVAACGSGSPPVAGLDFAPSALTLGWPELAEVRVRLVAERALPPEAGQPIVFLHLLDEPGSVVRTFDHALPGEWEAGRTYDYTVRLLQSALAEPLPAGEYVLSLGIYSPELGRFALRGEAREIAKLEYAVATVTVPPPAAAGARARFSENWLPPEPGGDRQVLARRTLAGAGAGTVQFGPLAGPGRIYVRADIPEETRDAGRVELAAGESQAKLKVSSSCGGEQVELAGAGGFDVELPVPEGVAGPCELTFEPNFQVRWRNRAESTSVRLVQLAWQPGPVDAAQP